MWIADSLLVCLVVLLGLLLKELRQFGFITAFNLTVLRNLAARKELTDEERMNYEAELARLRKQYPRYFSS
jgi:uncharacterized membrane protein YwaF